tara:strand:- start:34 stop:777 length:744 start_codon:yes stop_codon:yes gene_type:complete
MKPFGYYKNRIDTILENSYSNKKLFKENFHVIMGALKLSKPFREFFTLYNEIDKKEFKNSNELNEYITESITYLRPKIKSLKKVCNILEVVFSKRKSLLSENKNETYDSLDYIIYKKGVINISKRVVVKENLIESILNKKSTRKLNTKLTPQVLAYTLSENYNKEFANLNKEDKKLLSEVLYTDKDKVNEEVNNTRKDIIDKINTLVENTKDDTLKVRLTETKNVVIQMNEDKLSLLRLKQLEQDLN